MSDTELQPAPDLYPNQDPQALENAEDGTVSETVDALETNENPAYPPVNSGYNPEVHQQLIENVEENLDDVEPHLKEVDFSYATHADPARQVDRTGIYLDDVVRRDAELRRAAIEGREPDLENPGPTAFDVVQPTAVVQQNAPAGVVVASAFTQEVMTGSPPTDDVPEDEQPEPWDKNAVPTDGPSNSDPTVPLSERNSSSGETVETATPESEDSRLQSNEVNEPKKINE